METSRTDKAPHSSKLEELENKLGIVPQFDGLLELEGLDEDLSMSIPSTLDVAENRDRRGSSARNVLIMNEYTPAEFALALEAASLGDRVRALRLGAPVMQVDTSGNYVHRVTVSAEALMTTPNNGPVPVPREDQESNDRKDPWLITVLSRKGTGGFPVGSSNFIFDLFVRRRYMAYKDLKCYQEIMRTLPEEESALASMTRSFSRGLRMLPSFNSLTTAAANTTPQAAAAAAVSTLSGVLSRSSSPSTSPPSNSPIMNMSSNNETPLYLHNPDELGEEEPESEPVSSLPEGITRMQHLPSSANTHFQHEFKIDGDGKTAKTLHSFLTYHLPSRMSVTVIEWLAMQDPTLVFSPKRPQLPGQHHPGLGLGRQVTKMLISVSKEKGRDCLLSIPEYFHNAVVYKAAGWFFLNPAFEGYMRALLMDLGADIQSKGLAAVSWAFQSCHVVDASGVVEVWQAQEQFLPLSYKMRSYLGSSEYIRLVAKFTKRYAGKLRIDWANAKELERYFVSGGKAEE
ncbi:hypothetical protein CcCBS67573_g00554 [Chytriomyces confervae]|uniref:Uncharacterized protein n=1 Tax=Chytriomyces confervae TaxID=246404 RepID=A0A507FP47_9FUNG|nr:hypothetical protein HDU80_000063 [Chytriomyces hyalinus]TPX78211.1 hypothetical protein CcCBS67573_g00554 [Chytriomyces confervae]